MSYQNRVYEPHPSKMASSHARLRDHTLYMFEKHGIRNVGYWTAGAEEYNNRRVYMLALRASGRASVQHAAATQRKLTGPVAIG